MYESLYESFLLFISYRMIEISNGYTITREINIEFENYVITYLQ